MRSLKLTPVNLLWMSRFWSCYTITFVILAFSIAHLEIFPTLHPDLFSPKGLIHRLFSIYLIFNFFLNFFLLHVNHSFVPPPLLTTYIHESDGCSSDNITIEKRINFSIHPPPPSSSSSSSSLEDTFCRVCYIHKPPRCHHCVICNRCVLVREHHCFVLGTCIGYHNLRHFICILLILFIGSTYSLSQFFQYLPLFYPNPLSTSIIHYIPPISLAEVLYGSKSWHFLFHVLLLYTVAAAFVGSGYSTIYFLSLTLRGVTSHEHLTHQPPPNRSAYLNFKDSFGEKWYLGLLIPLFFQALKSNAGVKCV